MNLLPFNLQQTVTTEDRRLDQIIAMACAHVAANCNWREANRLAVAQHAHLCELSGVDRSRYVATRKGIEEMEK
jgi:hypothetical protein